MPLSLESGISRWPIASLPVTLHETGLKINGWSNWEQLKVARATAMVFVIGVRVTWVIQVEVALRGGRRGEKCHLKESSLLRTRSWQRLESPQRSKEGEKSAFKSGLRNPSSNRRRGEEEKKRRRGGKLIWVSQWFQVSAREGENEMASCNMIQDAKHIGPTQVILSMFTHFRHFGYQLQGRSVFVELSFRPVKLHWCEKSIEISIAFEEKHIELMRMCQYLPSQTGATFNNTRILRR